MAPIPPPIPMSSKLVSRWTTPYASGLLASISPVEQLGIEGAPLFSVLTQDLEMDYRPSHLSPFGRPLPRERSPPRLRATWCDGYAVRSTDSSLGESCASDLALAR